MSAAQTSVPFPSLLPRTQPTSSASSHYSHSHSHSPSSPSKASKASSSSWTRPQWLLSLLRQVLGRDSVSWDRLRRHIFSDADTRNLCIYFGFVCIYMISEVIVGMLTGSIALITDAIHTSFDGTVLVLSLLCMLISKRPSNSVFSFGYARFEVIAGFASACFLVFMGLFTLMEGIHQYFAEPHHSHHMFMFVISGVFVNSIGLVLFRSSYCFPFNAGFNRILNGGRRFNLYGIFLYIFCDALSKLCVLVTFLHPIFQSAHLRVLLALAEAGIIFYLSIPLLRASGMILLQTRPLDLAEPLRRSIRDISAFEGVLECRSGRWWSQVPGDTIGTLHVRVRADADEQAVLTYAYGVLSKVLDTVCIQIEKDASMDWIMNSASSR